MEHRFGDAEIVDAARHLRDADRHREVGDLPHRSPRSSGGAFLQRGRRLARGGIDTLDAHQRDDEQRKRELRHGTSPWRSHPGA